MVDHTAHGINLSLVFVEALVGQTQLHVRHLLQLLLQRATGLGQVQQLLLGHGEIDIHLANLRDGRHRLCDRGAHQATYTIGEGTHHAIRRTGHRTEGEVLIRAHQLRLRLCQAGFCRHQLVDSGLILEIADDLFLMQHLLVLLGQGQRVHVRLGHLHSRFRLTDSSRILGRINLEQGLSFPNGRTLIHTQFHHKARDLWTHFDVLCASNRSGIRCRLITGCCTDGHDRKLIVADFHASLAASASG